MGVCFYLLLKSKGCIMKSIFKDWDEIIKMPSQKEKLDKSFSEEYTPCYISRESHAATFGNDTKTIVCYLSKHNCCNCSEYQKREDGKTYPCSHVYRLAYELGLINKNGESSSDQLQPQITDQEKNDLFVDIINTIETNMSDDQQTTFIQSDLIDKISNCVFSPTHTPFREERTSILQFLNLGLLEICNDSNLGLIYYHGFRTEIVSYLDENEFEWDNNLPKTKSGSVQAKSKRDWCLTHPNETVKYAFSTKEDKYIMVRPSSKLIKVWTMVLKYFERKYYDTEETDRFNRYIIRHPTGAIITNHTEKTFDFPHDIITEQLTQRGYNRCITLVDGIKIANLYKEPRNGSTLNFSIKHPQQSDYSLFVEPLEGLGRFYDIPKEQINIDQLMDVIDHLKQLDALFDSYIEENFVVLTVIRSIISKNIKDELEVKKDFNSIKVQLNNGKIVVGYTKIVSELNKGHVIKNMIL